MCIICTVCVDLYRVSVCVLCLCVLVLCGSILCVFVSSVVGICVCICGGGRRDACVGTCSGPFHLLDCLFVHARAVVLTTSPVRFRVFSKK